jgi:hypothetical protein
MGNVIRGFCLLTVLATPSLAFSQVQAVKDPAAQAVLARMGSATGWVAAGIPQDATASGTVTTYQGSQDNTSTITFEAKGLREFRSQVNGADGVSTYILNQDAAVVVTPTSVEFIPIHSAISESPFVFPFFSVMLLASEPNVATQYVGTETVNGQQADRVDLLRQPGATDPLTTLRSVASHLVVWVSTSTGLPVQIQETHIANDNPTAIANVVRVFSNFRTVSGVSMPFQQDVSVGQNKQYSVQLQSVNLNVGLLDSDFALPASAQ